VTNPAAALDRTVLVLQDYVAAPGEEIVTTLTSLRVKLTASGDTLDEPNGQVALLAAFEAIARLGVEVVLDVPRDAVVNVPAPPLARGPLYDSLEHLASRLIQPLGADGNCDLTFSFDRQAAEGALVIGASDFEGRLRVGTGAGGFDGQLPFGAVLAGAFAAAEVARVAIKRLIGAGYALVDSIPLEHHDVTLSLAPFEYPEYGADLGSVEFVSAGAITHAALFTLARIPRLSLSGRVFDDDVAAEDNLNRYVLLDADSLGKAKEEHLADLDWLSFSLRGIHRRVGEGELIAVDLGDRVVVGVDSVEARWNVQGLAPGWVGVGATSHALAMVSQHWPDTPCSGCVHPVPSPLATRLPTISFVSLIAGALLAHRLMQSAVAPVRATEVDYVLDALRLASAEPFLTERPHAVEHCPVGCAATRAVAEPASNNS
jgi:hypothetical protein